MSLDVQHMSVRATVPLSIPHGRMVEATVTMTEHGNTQITFISPDLVREVLSEALHNRVIKFDLGFTVAAPGTEGDAYCEKGDDVRE